MRGDDELIAGFLLGELPPERRADVEARLARDPGFAEEVERMRSVVTALEGVPAAGWPAADGPALPPLPPLPGLEDTSRTRLRRWSGRPRVALAGAVVALAVGIVVGSLLTRGGDGGDPSGPALALARVDDGGPSARGRARLSGDALRLDVSGLAPNRAGAFYEVWLMDDADRLLSLGGFRVPASGAAEVEVPLPVPLRDFAFIDVSLEREDGNPAHSGVSVLRGPT